MARAFQRRIDECNAVHPAHMLSSEALVSFERRMSALMMPTLKSIRLASQARCAPTVW